MITFNDIPPSYYCNVVTRFFDHTQSLIKLRGESRWACPSSQHLNDVFFFFGEYNGTLLSDSVHTASYL